MNAIILAAGEGKRLMPLTKNTPKALININGKPLLQYHLDKLLAHDYKNIIVTCFTHADQIKKFLIENYAMKKVQVSEERELLGTGGGIKNAMKLINNDDCLIVNADIFSDIDYGKFKDCRSPKVFAVRAKKGDFNIKKNKVFLDVSRGYTFTGISIINQSFFSKINLQVFDYWQEVLKPIAALNELEAEIIDANWYDVGTMDALKNFRNE